MTSSADLRPDQKNRAKELIEDFMIAANGVTARYLAEEGIAVAAPRAAHAEALGPHRRSWPRSSATRCRREPDAARARRLSWRSAGRPIPMRFPDLSLSVVKLLGSGEYAVDVPGQPSEGTSASPCGTTRTPPRRTGDFPDLVTQRLLKAALAGTRVAVHQRRARGAGAPLHRAGGQRGKGRAAGARSPRPRCCSPSRIGRRFDAIVTGASDKGTWVRISGPTAEGRVVAAASRASTSAIGCASSSSAPTSSAASSTLQPSASGASRWHTPPGALRSRELCYRQPMTGALPEPIAEYFERSNSDDAAGRVADCFTEDAVVHDERQHIRGRDAVPHIGQGRYGESTISMRRSWTSRRSATERLLPPI